jgi:hypothetical protein
LQQIYIYIYCPKACCTTNVDKLILIYNELHNKVNWFCKLFRELICYCYRAKFNLSDSGLFSEYQKSKMQRFDCYCKTRNPTKTIAQRKKKLQIVNNICYLLLRTLLLAFIIITLFIDTFSSNVICLLSVPISCLVKEIVSRYQQHQQLVCNIFKCYIHHYLCLSM